jgi:hypothetical protein
MELIKCIFNNYAFFVLWLINNLYLFLNNFDFFYNFFYKKNKTHLSNIASLFKFYINKRQRKKEKHDHPNKHLGESFLYRIEKRDNGGECNGGT